MPKKKKVKDKRKRKEPSIIDLEEGNKFIFCRTKVIAEGKLRYKENRVFVQVCKERSQGIIRRPELKEYVEENCLGCTKWIELLRNNK